MERWVFARRTVTGDIDTMKMRLVTDTPALLQAATDTQPSPPEGDGSFRLLLSTDGGRVGKGVVAHIEQAKTEGSWTRIPLAWHADSMSRLFPTFEGSLETEDFDSHTMSIAVIGRYRPPGSVIGGVADRLALPHVAEDTVERMVRGLVATFSDDVNVPHGDVGQQMTVEELMSDDPIVLNESMSLRAAASLLLSCGISGAPVVDDNGQLVGVLSESDLLDKVAPARSGLDRTVELSWRRHGATTVGQACSRPARSTAVETPVRAAAGQMAARGVARLAVLRGATIAGIITRTDVMKALIRGDEAIESVVELVVGEMELEGVHADVADGLVRLTGDVPRRSQAEQLRSRLEDIEGVLEVQSESLTWQSDDTAVAPPMWM